VEKKKRRGKRTHWKRLAPLRSPVLFLGKEGRKVSSSFFGKGEREEKENSTRFVLRKRRRDTSSKGGSAKKEGGNTIHVRKGRKTRA